MRAISLIFMLALSVASTAMADDTAGFQTLLAEKLKESKPVWILSPYSKPAVAAFLPVWTFHDLAGKDYLEFGAGGKFRDGEKPYPFIGFGINLVALSGRLWSFPWAVAHVKRSKFPDLFLGPGISTPMELDSAKDWTWKANTSIVGSVRFGAESPTPTP